MTELVRHMRKSHLDRREREQLDILEVRMINVMHNLVLGMLFTTLGPDEFSRAWGESRD